MPPEASSNTSPLLPSTKPAAVALEVPCISDAVGRIAPVMDTGRNAQHWLMQSAAVLGRVTSARRRLSASLGVNEVTMLAAADELEVATREARAWMVSNFCPDGVLGSHVLRLLNTCAEVAHAAQRAIIDPSIETKAVLGRLAGLLAIINMQAQELDDW
jgi:hypothetical protein